MNDNLTELMTQLPEPAPPPSLSATVMARIAREADRQRAPSAEEAVSMRRHRERPAWVWAVAGLAVVLYANAYWWFATGLPPDVTSPRIGRTLVLIPLEGPTALVIGLGVLVYLAGLFAPLRSRGSA